MRAARDTEVVVVGGGVAGCSVALGLLGAGVSTVIVEARDDAPRPWRPGETLPPAARPHLQALGIWDDFVADGHLPVAGSRSAWGDGTAAERDFLFDPYGPGWHLDRLRFDATMARAARRAGAEWVTCRPAAVARTPDGWAVDVDGGTLHAAVIVDASGRSSALGRACGARRRVVDRLVALVAVVGPEPDHRDRDPRVLVEAAPAGWWYSAALPDGRLVTAYMTDPDLLPADAGRRHSHVWSDLLDDAPLTSARIGPRPETSVAPRVAAAGSSVLVPPEGSGWLAVGDAAATHDPLSSQGITTALAHGRSAASAVAAARGGDHEAVRRYAATVVTDYARYLSMRAGYYALERRWPDSPFWERRHRLVAGSAPAVRRERRPLVPSPAAGGRPRTGGRR